MKGDLDNLSLFLHIYQPPTQFSDVLRIITEKSYLRITEILKRIPEAKLTLNIPGALTEQWEEHGFNRLITDLTDLVRKGQVELTGSAAYHSLLFKLPKSEIVRQIKLNERINRHYFGDTWAPRGFFPPEMAVDERVLKVIEECGYEWVVLEQVQSSPLRQGGGQAPFKVQSENRQVFLRRGGKLKIVFRNRELSLKVAFGKIRTVEGITTAICENRLLISENPVLVLDGETFGWHQPEQLGLLEEFFTTAVETQHTASLRCFTVSELVDRLPVGSEIRVGKTSWGKRVERGGEVYYPRWEDPENEIHQMQWELTNLAIGAVQSSKHKVSVNGVSGDRGIRGKKNTAVETIDTLDTIEAADAKEGLTAERRQWLEARHLLDRALHSDQYWWAGGREFWHPQMVGRGARMLRDTVLTVPDASNIDRRKARDFYGRIVETGKELHGEEVKE